MDYTIILTNGHKFFYTTYEEKTVVDLWKNFQEKGGIEYKENKFFGKPGFIPISSIANIRNKKLFEK